MIAKVTKGSSFGGLMNYLYGPGKHDEHEDPHLVGGNLAVAEDPRGIAGEFRELAAENPRVRQPVYHVSLSLPENERLSDEQWAQAGGLLMERMGFQTEDGREAPWVMVRHDGERSQHAHLVASRVRFDGSRVDVFRDWKRSHEATRAIETEHGLSAPQASLERLAPVSRSERESAGRRGVDPERAQLREALEQARDTSNGTREDFEERAGERGVLLRANESPSTGRMNGYSASLEGWRDASGGQVWVPASRVHRSLSWKQLGADLEQRRERAPEPRRWAGGRAEREQPAMDRAPQRESAAGRALREARERDRTHEQERGR